MLAINRDDRIDGDARCLHVDQQKGNALLLLFFMGSAQQAENPVGMLRKARPDFRAIDDVIIAVRSGGTLQRGKVGARSRFGIALCPESCAVENAGEPALLL